MKLKDKKHTVSQRIGRVEKVVSQLYMTMVDLNARLTLLDGGIKQSTDEETK